MGLLEAQVHHSLKEFLRQRPQSLWTHHLTMGRLISRALRLQRSALIQTGSSPSRYYLSYLLPALLSEQPILLVVSDRVKNQLEKIEIPQLEQWLNQHYGAISAENLIITTPQIWLRDRLEENNNFPANITTVIDQADYLEEWARDYLSLTLNSENWEQLMLAVPQHQELIRETRIYLTKALFLHPPNPYNCYLLEKAEKEYLSYLLNKLEKNLPEKNNFLLPFQSFWKEWQETKGNQLLWATINREKGQFTLHLSPIDLAGYLKTLWQVPLVMIGSFLDADKEATTFRKNIGLEDLLCLKFLPSRQSQSIQLYLPDRLPLPNTPEFKGVIFEQIQELIRITFHQHQQNSSFKTSNNIVILLDDVPLKAQLGSILAAEFGTKVQIEKTHLSQNSILISGWDFWHYHQDDLPSPQLLIIATLPLPSLEHPLVASRVKYYKRQHQDWFRSYLLPTALQAIQRAVMPLRESQGIVTILDSRVNSYSYGKQILGALEPYAKSNYIDDSWFNN
jgi:ATP-dependent DNA helicase DinG